MFDFIEDVKEVFGEFNKLEIVGMLTLAVLGVILFYSFYCVCWLLAH